VSDYLLSFKENLEAGGKSALTVKSCLPDTKHFRRWFEETTGESFGPEAVTAPDVHTYKAHLLKEKRYRPATVNRKLSSLSMFYRWARREGLMQEDPIQEVSVVEEVKGAPRALTHHEVVRLLLTVYRGQKARDIAILEVLANTGLRVGELAALTL
jgi:integrase/recombinase XerC